MRNANELVKSHDILLVTLDTLRYDVAQNAFLAGDLPNFANHLPESGWELRHTPGNFTFAAHQAFFAGFLPTPADPNANQERLFAAKFIGSETTGERTCLFEAPDIVEGFRQLGFHTLCVGGVGFFNKLTPLGSVLPGLFDESHWDVSLSVTDKESFANQIEVIRDSVTKLAQQKGNDHPLFTFLNVSAIHQPNCIYVENAESDSIDTMSASLRYVDRLLLRLLDVCRSKRDTFCIFMSDHGTAYGEDGYFGHRLSHETVWNVPYAEFEVEKDSTQN